MFLIPVRDSAPRYRRPFVVPVLVLLNVVIYVYLARSWLAGEEYEWLYARLGVSPANFLDEWGAVFADPGRFIEAPSNFFMVAVVPLLSYQFLHGSPLHLFGNMLFLWVFGDNVEGRLGRGRFLLFYLSCGVLAALTHCMMLPNDWAPVIGASGSIAGILGAYLFLFPKARVTLLAWVVIFVTFVEVPAWLLLITYFVLQIPDVQGFLNFAGTQGIAWWAHVGGFLAGASLLPLFLLRNPRPFTKQLARQR